MKTSGLVHKPSQAIKNIRGTPAAYETTAVFENGGYQTYVVTHCIECGHETRIHWNTGGADPAFVERKLRGLGWQFDAYKPRRCVCPSCITGRNKLAQEEPMAKTATNSFTPATMPGTATAVLGATAAVVGAEAFKPTLTAHEKSKIRAALDSHFDDSLGRYIDNYDDQRVAKELDIPLPLVTELREFAYGPLKADPAVEAFTKELDLMQQELKALSNAIEAMRARVEAYSGRLVNLEAKAKKLP